MTLKGAYLIIIIVFYLSIIIGFNKEKIALLVHGYDIELAFKKYDVINDHEMISKYYYAYEESAKTITLITRAAIAIWIVTLLFSSYVVYTKTVTLPIKLEVITLFISLTIVALFVLLPALLFGKGPPPSPL